MRRCAMRPQLATSSCILSWALWSRVVYGILGGVCVDTSQGISPFLLPAFFVVFVFDHLFNMKKLILNRSDMQTLIPLASSHYASIPYRLCRCRCRCRFCHWRRHCLHTPADHHQAPSATKGSCGGVWTLGYAREETHHNTYSF